MREGERDEERVVPFQQSDVLRDEFGRKLWLFQQVENVLHFQQLQLQAEEGCSLHIQTSKPAHTPHTITSLSCLHSLLPFPHYTPPLTYPLLHSSHGTYRPPTHPKTPSSHSPHYTPPTTHPLRADKRVHFRYSDDVGHECAQPLGVQEVQLTQLALQVIVVKEDSTLVEKMDSLRGRWR